MTEADIRKAISEVVIDVDVAAIQVDQDFIDAGMDSLDYADVLLNLQEGFGLEVSDDDLEFCRSIQGLLEFAARGSAGE